MMEPKKYCILLTGTIEPNNTFSLKRTNALDRENDYYRAIMHWLKYNVPVVFCENSNYKSEKMNAISNKNFEFIQYKENTDISEKGKGLGEYLLMQYAFENSKLLSNNDYVLKITGRLYFKNLDKYLKIASKLDFVVMSPLELKLTWADSRFFIFHKSFFSEYFKKFAININDATGYCFERALACAIHLLMSDRKKWEMLPKYPRYKGYSGTYNKKHNLLYNLSFIKVIKFPMFRYFSK